MKFLTALLLLTTTLFAESPRVLLFSGSTREASLNKKLIAEAARIAQEDGAHVQVIDLGKDPIPHYDGDIESQRGMPPSAKALRDEMLKSQVVIISTPNYNGGISGILKDALDWASRTPEGLPSKEAFQGKTFVILSASPSSKGGKPAAQQLEALVKKMKGIVCGEIFSLGNAHEAFDEKGGLKDKKKEQKLKTLIQSALRGQC